MEDFMRACFLGQNVCALGNGVAIVQTAPLGEKPKPEAQAEPPSVPKGRPENRMFEEFKRQDFVRPHHS
jgi:hypothetical protein